MGHRKKSQKDGSSSGDNLLARLTPSPGWHETATSPLIHPTTPRDQTGDKLQRVKSFYFWAPKEIKCVFEIYKARVVAACCTLYIELSTHALTLRSIITIKNSFTILTKTKRNSLLKTSQELEGSFKTQFSSFQSAMFGCRGGLRLRILS